MTAQHSSPPDPPARRGLPLWLTLTACMGILLATAAVLLLIFTTEPTAQREGAVRQSAVMVDTLAVQPGNHSPAITGLGTVIPAREIQLQPLVDGPVVKIYDAFSPGAIVKAGASLVRIEEADYRNRLTRLKAEYQTAKANLRIEEGRQRVAREEFDLLDNPDATIDRDLVLRQPQLATAQAAVDAARAAVQQAELDLRRTHLRVPFPARILERSVNLGSVVSAGDDLGRLIGIGEFWIETAVPLRHLAWIPLADQSPNTTGAPVRIRNRSAWPDSAVRTGTALRAIGAVDQTTRLARILVRVPDPLARSPETSGPPLTLGSVVHTTITGRAINHSIKLNRNHLRSGDTVWLLVDGTLAIREVDIAFKDSTHAFITSGLQAGDQLVISELANPREGMELRRRGERSPSTPAPDDTIDPAS